jgi:DNA-binding transcriptional LysR family regulator
MGDLAFGVGPFPAATMVPALLTEIRTRYPGVCVQVEVNNADHLAAHLRAEQLDFYMADVRNVVAAADLTVTRVARLSAGFYVRVAPMATPNRPTCGRSNCSRQDRVDYDYSGLTAMRAAASLRR